MCQEMTLPARLGCTVTHYVAQEECLLVIDVPTHERLAGPDFHLWFERTSHHGKAREDHACCQLSMGGLCIILNRTIFHTLYI